MARPSLRACRAAVVAMAAAATCLPAAPAAAGRTPTAAQLLYQKREVSMFMHFSMCTFAPHGGCEQDTACRTNPPSLFNPQHLNTTQWMETAVALGAKEVCLTAHHTGGFALFQSNHTNYSIRQSPYKGGKGDIVKEFTDSCRAHGISPCLYFINAWDCWESADSPAVYLERTLGMLTELSNRDVYGKIDRFWFDQYGFGASPTQAPAGLFPAAWPRVVEHVHTVSPGTMMLPGPDGCLNPGEGGGGQYPIVNYVNSTIDCSYPWLYPKDTGAVASIYGHNYVPYESDLSIQNPGDAWFWHEGHVFDSGAQLFDKYLATAGRGSHFILNVPPNTSGLVPEAFVQSVAAMGSAVAASFGPGTDAGAMPYPATGKCGATSVVVSATGPFDAVVLTEGLEHGQGILAYTLEVQDRATGGWSAVGLDPKEAGLTVGSKSIAVLGQAAAGAGAVRFNCTRSIKEVDDAYGVTLAAFSLHALAPPVSFAPLRSYWSAKANDTAPCATRYGGTCSGYTTSTDAYMLLREEALVLTEREAGDPATAAVHLVYSLAATDNGFADVGTGGATDPALAPAGYVDEAVAAGEYGDAVAVYTQAAPGRVRLDVYYSAAREDFWVVGSAASRAEARAQGYALVKTLGYGLAARSPGR